MREAPRSLLIGRVTGVVAAYADRQEAETRRDRFNADPWLDVETPDPDAPYRVAPEQWGVVCVHPSGSSRVIARFVFDTPEEAERAATKRSCLPVAIAMGFQHEAKRVVSDGKYGFIVLDAESP